MNDFPGIPDDERGMIAKYVAFRLPTGRVIHNEEISALWNGTVLSVVSDPFMLLKFKNAADRKALETYAKEVSRNNPKFAADIRRKLAEFEPEASDDAVAKLRARLAHNEGINPSDLV